MKRPLLSSSLALTITLLLACGGDGDAPVAEDAVREAAPVPAAATATGAASTLDEPGPVSGEMLPYGEAGDELLRGYFAFPEAMLEPAPAVLMIHDWWGLNEVVQQQARDLAGQGFMVLALDLFHGKTAQTTAEAGVLARQLLEETEFAETSIRAAHTFVADIAGAPAVATMGWAQGGYWSQQSAALLPGDVSAVVVYYSQVDPAPEQVALLEVPMLGLFAGQDRSIPAADARAFRETAQSLGKAVDIVIYPDAQHGFANPDDARFDADSASAAWERVVTFLRAQLLPG